MGRLTRLLEERRRDRRVEHLHALEIFARHADTSAFVIHGALAQRRFTYYRVDEITSCVQVP